MYICHEKFSKIETFSIFAYNLFYINFQGKYEWMLHDESKTAIYKDSATHLVGGPLTR